MQSTILVILPPWAIFRSLSPCLCRFCLYDISTFTCISQRTVNKTSWSNQRQTRICYIFRLWVIIKALLKIICLYLLSHFRIRIILLSVLISLQEISRNRACLQNHTITMMRGQYYVNRNLRSLSVCSCSCEDSRVPPLNLYYDISIAEDLHCR